jgi:hypothetical protein
MLVLAMEFSRGTTAGSTAVAPWQRKRNNPGLHVRHSTGGNRLERSEELPTRVTPTTTEWTVQERIASDQLRSFSCRPEAKSLRQPTADRDSLERR